MVTKARKSIAAFKLREGMAIGCMVTLRGDRMYEFFDRLVNVALPRVRDFRGVSTKSFDGRGNYTLGIKDQLIFPEIDYTKVDKTKGMNISITTTARTDAEGRVVAEAARDAVPAVGETMSNNGNNRQDRQGSREICVTRQAGKKTPKLQCRHRNRCWRCGRPRGYLRKFGICRICFRQLALDGRNSRRDQGELVERRLSDDE